METLHLVVGYFLVAFPPLFGIGMLLEPKPRLIWASLSEVVLL